MYKKKNRMPVIVTGAAVGALILVLYEEKAGGAGGRDCKARSADLQSDRRQSGIP